jgi:hypothetical protein
MRPDELSALAAIDLLEMMFKQDYENNLYGFTRWNGAYWVHR